MRYAISYAEMRVSISGSPTESRVAIDSFWQWNRESAGDQSGLHLSDH